MSIIVILYIFISLIIILFQFWNEHTTFFFVSNCNELFSTMANLSLNGLPNFINRKLVFVISLPYSWYWWLLGATNLIEKNWINLSAIGCWTKRVINIISFIRMSHWNEIQSFIQAYHYVTPQLYLIYEIFSSFFIYI